MGPEEPLIPLQVGGEPQPNLDLACNRVLTQGIRGPVPSRPFPITMTASGLSPEDRNEQLLPDVLSELGSRQEPMMREEARLELAGVGDEARLLEVR